MYLHRMSTSSKYRNARVLGWCLVFRCSGQVPFGKFVTHQEMSKFCLGYRVMSEVDQADLKLMETKLQTSDCGIGGGGDESNGVTLSKSIAGFKDLGGEEVSIEKRLWQMSKRSRMQNAILNSKSINRSGKGAAWFLSRE